MSHELPLLPLLREEIRRSGPLSFYRFMELCLYHPQHGYYVSGRRKLGAGGDFYTSAHLAPVLARLLAQHLERLWNILGRPARFDLVELGPGDGSLASELLPWARYRFPEFFVSLHYLGVEQSPQGITRIEERLREFSGHARIAASNDWLSGQMAEEGLQGCVFANEFFDALPVHWLVWREEGWRERYVSIEEGKLRWIEGPPSDLKLVQEAERRFAPDLPAAERPDGWVAELRPGARLWMEQIARRLERGQALIFDYGYTLDEWRQGRFSEGSTLGYRLHQVAYDLLANPGDQDLTAHVDFTELIETGEQAGLRLRSLESQAQFLLGIGQADEFGEVFLGCASEEERLRRARSLKTLILPQGMGETFRVLRMEKRLW